MLGVLSLLMGLMGLVIPFLPFDMDGYRRLTSFPLAVIGIALGIVGVIGPRAAKPLAAIGIGFSGLAFALGSYFLLLYFVL